MDSVGNIHTESGRMNKKVYHTLEFDKILERLSGLADSEPGKKLARELRPFTRVEEVSRELSETAAAEGRIRAYGSMRFSGIRNLDNALSRLSVGAGCSLPELLLFRNLLELSGKARKYGRVGEDEEREDSLREYFRELEALASECRELQRCIISEEELSDDASPALYSVRKKLHGIEGRIHGELTQILNRSRTMLQDAVVTMRDGRYCLPVRAEYKASFPGIVLDQSASGQTLFIEPMAVFRLSNELRELEIEEKREIELVLRSLSELLMPHIEVLARDGALLSHLDFVFAKAKLAGEMNATEPSLNAEKYICLRAARHPLIDPAKVVPITVMLGKEFHLLIITGPNTGGKTVCLKTVGMFQLMGQSGLFLPAAAGSEISIFTEIFADIGDEQSIEQSLSTFSSHMTNTVSILRRADKNSLCLFDELGAGTDPTEGAALAMAILHSLKEKGIRTMATTHYAEIKLYALSTEGVENASCEFDVESLSPTYRLLIGIPGKSNAFAISRKLGLSDRIIDDARRRIDKEDVKLEDVIRSLEESRQTVERERAEIEKYRAESAEYKRRARESSLGVEKGKDKILRRAREEAQEILNDAKETADRIVKELRQQQLSGGRSLKAEQTRAELNQKWKHNLESLSEERHKGPAQPVSAKKLQLGDVVRVIPMQITARVTSLPERDDTLFVSSGILKTKVRLRDIEFIQHAEEEKQEGAVGRRAAGRIGMSKSMGISPELNIIGKMTAEALPELVKYLDDAYLAHLPQVRIVHGRGTGALKKMVHTELKKNRHVESFRLGEYGEGSDGVTIAFLKK